MVINALPYQVRSSHERIAVAQYTGAAVLSDKNPYLAQVYKDHEDIYFYDYHKGALASRIMEVLKDDQVQAVAEKGRKKIQKGALKKETRGQQIENQTRESFIRNYLVNHRSRHIWLKEFVDFVQ